jgi:hypothetical protein
VIAKRLALLAGALLVSLLLLEVGTRVAHRIRHGEPFPGDDLREQLAPSADLDRLIPSEQAAGDHPGVKLSNKVTHPYLGYVLDHGRGKAAKRPVNRFGFHGIDPLTKPEPNVVRVAIAGGSVALQLFNNGGAVLAERLAAAPAFAGKRIELVALSMGGYKQPQSLLALTWLQSLGAHFDVVINLDGFNEVVLPTSDNAPNGIHASFPRSWHFYQTKMLDAERLEYATEARRLLEEQREVRARFGTGLSSQSALVLTLLNRLDSSISEEIVALDADFQSQLNAAGLGFQATGPFVPHRNDVALLRELVALWQASSLQMHRLTTAAGGHYFHFLQPNQWVKGAKPFSGIERRQLQVDKPFPPRTVVPRAYPMLTRAGAELKRQGVAFQSLVLLFAEEDRTVYRDTCCHFNRFGITEIAAEIARVVSEALDAANLEPAARADSAG